MPILTVTTLAEDQVLIATYGRVWRRVELIQAGRRRWRRWGIPDLMPGADPDRRSPADLLAAILAPRRPRRKEVSSQT